MEPLLRGQSAPGAIPEHESSADETTGIVMSSSRRGGNKLNYQSTSPSGGSGASRRKPALAKKAGQTEGQLPEQAGPAQDDDRTGPEQDGAAVGPKHKSMKKRFRGWLKNFQSFELENKGSVARDHLALERTFLAWLRTSLAFASIGVAITQLFRLNTSLSDNNDSSDEPSHLRTLRHIGKPLGATFLGISILILFLGYNRYFTSQQWIMKGKFPASRGTVMLVTFVAFSLMIASLVVVIVVQPTTDS